MEASEVNQLLEGQTTFAKEQDGLKLHYVLPQEERDERERGFRVFSIGQPADRPTKCVLMLGETGAGKTTFINAVINYLFGVRFEDSFRLLVKEETDDTRMETESQTNFITAYIVYYKEGMKHKYNFVFIDTPGQADTRGAQHQQDTRCRLEAFLTSDFGVDELNCVGLVAKANINRDLTSHQAMLGEIISLLGNTVPESTHILATFAADKRTVLDTVMRKAGVTFQNVFQFDNGVLFSSQMDDAKVPLRWDDMSKHYETFIGALLNFPSVDTRLLREKKQFDTCKKKLKTLVEGLATSFVTLETDTETYRRYELQETENEGWRQEEIIVERTLVPTQNNSHAHNCDICQQTCIYPCHNFINIDSNTLRGLMAAGGAALSGLVDKVGGSRAAAEVGDAGVGGGFTGLGFVTTAFGTGIVIKAAYDKLSNLCNVGLNNDVCGKDGCTHSLSQHAKEERIIVRVNRVYEKIDLDMKVSYDEAIAKKQQANDRIDNGKNKILKCRESMSHTTVDLLYHAKRIQELTFQDLDCIEDVSCQLDNEIRLGDPNIIPFALKSVSILKEAMTRLEPCTTEEILGKHGFVEDMLINLCRDH